MKRLLRALEVLAWGGFFAFALLVLAVRFWVLPDIERYREDIVAAMSRGLGLPVRVGEIRASWMGLRPQIGLSDVRIYDAQGREALVLPSIDNVVAWRSLLHGELRLHRLVIEGPRVTVRRDPAGALYVAGLKLEPGQGGGAAGLLAQSDVLVRGAEIEWRDELRNAPPLVFSDLELSVEQHLLRRGIGLKARIAPELGSSIELRALLEGPELSGRVFLQIGYTDLAAWRAWVDYPLHLREGQGALRVWATLDKGELKAATADVALADVTASLADELTPLELVSLQGRVTGRSLADGLEVSGRGLSLVVAGGPQIPKTDFQIVWRPQAGGALAASALDLDAIADLAGSLPIPPQIAGMLEELAPRGRLSHARLEWSGPFDAPTRFAARAQFADLSMRPREAVPGFSGLSGSVEATQERGKLTLASARAALELPRVFPEARIPLDTLAGAAEWERDAGRGVTVRVSSLSFANDHASGNLFGAYTWSGEGPGSLDLSAVLNRADARYAERYLPHILPPVAREWLTNAIVAGEASDVRVRVRGDLRQFPFIDPASGQFQVVARVEKGVLDYARGWPRINDIAGELTFERDRVEVAGRSASILGAQLSNVRVSLPSLRSADRHVMVSGQAEGPSAEFLRFIGASPLRDVAEFATTLSVKGNGKLRVKLDLPLAALSSAKVSGEYEFAANQVGVLSWLPPIDAAAGRLGFTESGFTLHDVRGRLYGGPIALSGGTRAARRVDVIARGSAQVAEARALLEHPLTRHLSGTLPYVVRVRAPQEGLAGVVLESPLRGVESALPAPLAKAAAESLPLRLEYTPQPGGQRDRIALTLGAIARADVARQRQGEAMVATRAGVWLTPERGAPARLPERGMLFHGSLAAFDLDRWLPLLQEGDGAGAQPVSVELAFGTLVASGRPLKDVALRARSEANGWTADVKSDAVEGEIAYRTRPQPRVVARLARFSVPETPAQSARPLQPRDLPALDFAAEEFTLRGKRLGRVRVETTPAGDDVRIDRVSMVNPDASFNGSGVWHGGANARTQMKFDLEAFDVGSFLGRVGQPGLVKGGKAQLQGALRWRGDPATLDFASLRGDLQLQVQDGQFLEIEPGLGKLIGLMSLQALPRRITLDFSDVFSKGFRFDRIASAAEIDNGAVQLKEFRMRGPSADVEMNGGVDLARETQELRVRVVPSLGDSAAIGIGIVNPVAGVAAAIAQRLLKNPLGQIFAFDYAVSGTWGDPKVEKIPPPPLPEQIQN